MATGVGSLAKFIRGVLTTRAPQWLLGVLILFETVYGFVGALGAAIVKGAGKGIGAISGAIVNAAKALRGAATTEQSVRAPPAEARHRRTTPELRKSLNSLAEPKGDPRQPRRRRPPPPARRLLTAIHRRRANGTQQARARPHGAAPAFKYFCVPPLQLPQRTL